MAEVKFKFIGDDSELRKKLAGLAKLQADINFGFGKRLTNMGSNAVSEAVKQVGQEAIKSGKDLEVLNRIANSNSLRDSKLADMEAMRKARLAIQEEILEQKKLRSAVEQGKITQQEYRSELAKITVEEKKRSIALRDIKKQLSETSEYGKLNKALGELRKQSKDVLAEMFRMERQGHANTIGYEALRKKSEGLVSQTLILDKGIKKIDATLGLHQRNVGNYGEALELISPQIASINQKLQLFGTSLDDLSGKPGAIRELGASFVTMGKGILTFLLSPVGLLISTLGALFLLFKSNRQTVIDFNSGLRNVSKTTELTGKDLRSFGSAIVDLSMKLKVVDATKLLEYATAAGQLGVRGRADILAFTEALAMLETASDIKGEEGASRIARTLTLIDGGVQNVKAFGDEIVNLGNNFAATESEILSNAESISQNVGIYKIGRQQVLAFATATKAVGLEAELVGSTFSRTLGEFEKSLRSGKGVSDLLKVIGGTSQDLSRRFREDAADVFVDYVKGLNNIYKTGGSVNEALERTGIVAVRDQRVIASLASNGYDVLSDALLKVSDANGAMQQEFENGAGKLENQTKRMGIAWDNFVISIEDGEGIIGRSVVGIVGFFAELLDQINKTFNPTSFDEFLARLGSFEVADKIRDINKTMESSQEMVNGMSDFNLSTARIDQLKSKYSDVESTLKTLQERIKSFKNDVKSGVLNDSGKNTVKDLETQSNVLASYLWQLDRKIKSAPNVIANNLSFEDSEKERLKREKAEAAAAKNAERAVENRRQAVERQRALQLSIDQTNEQVLRNQLSRDESEVESVKDKYAKIKEEVRKFYADPKNKGQKVDMSGLLASEKFEVSEAETKSGTKLLVESLSKQKQLHDEYNAFASQTSKEEADKRYANELKAFKGYKERLRKEYMDIIALQTIASSEGFEGSNVKLTQAQEERAKVLRELIASFDKEERDKENSKYISAIQASKSFNDQIIEIEKKHQQYMTSLGENATEEQKKILKKSLDEEKSAILVAQFDRIANTERMFERLSFLGKKASLDAIDAARKVLIEQRAKGMTDRDFEKKTIELDSAEAIIIIEKSWIASTRALKRYREQLALYSKDSDQAKRSQKDMFSALASDLQNASSIIGDVGGLLGSLGASDGTQNTVNQIGQLVGGMSELATGIASGNPVAIISGSIKTLTSVVDIFNTKDKKIQKQIDAYKDQLDSLGKAYDRLQNQINNSVGENYYTDSDKAISNLREQQRLLEEMAKSEEGKKKTDKEKVKGYYNEIDSINNQIEELQKAISENLVQTSFKELSNSLADALLSAFEAGEDGIEALDKTFDQFIKKALVNSLKLKMIEPIVNEMVSKVSDYMKGNNNSLIGFDFDSWKDKIGEAGKNFNSALDEAYKGIGLEKDSSSTGGGLSGGIKRELTENTASELTGLYRSTFDVMKQSLQQSKLHGLTLSKQLDIASSSLTALNAIQNNTANTVTELKSAVSELQKVNKNLGGKF